jgi:hypothetical protein
LYIFFFLSFTSLLYVGKNIIEEQGRTRGNTSILLLSLSVKEVEIEDLINVYKKKRIYNNL